MEARVLSVVADEGGRQIRCRRPKRDGGVSNRHHKCTGPTGKKSHAGCEGWVLVPQTDTGRRVEDTQANGRTFVKEFGKLAP